MDETAGQSAMTLTQEMNLTLRGRHPATVQVCRHFSYTHLPQYLAEVSFLFATLAVRLLEALPDGPELTVALRKLLESKDAAVRARIDAGRTDDEPE
jgi:hypothetical protein